MNPIRNAVTDYIETRHVEGNRKRGHELSQLEPRIPVSQIGHCPRQAILEAVRWHPDHPLHAEPSHDFDAYVKEIMEAGNVWEHQTGKALAEQFDGTVHWERDDPALRVRNDVWSGHIDFLIGECADFPAGAIIIPTYLYYRSWSTWGRHTPPPWPGDFAGSWSQVAGGAGVARWTGRWPGAGCGSSTQGERTWPECRRKFARLAEQGEIEATMIPTPEEEDFFRVLDVPCWPPHERTAERLRRHLQQK